MGEWSLERLPTVLKRHIIPLQVPTVVGQRVDIPSALIAFVHHLDIVVEVLTLILTEAFTVLWKIVQIGPK